MVVIFGFGGIGLLVIIGVRMVGVLWIIGIDINESKFELVF